MHRTAVKSLGTLWRWLWPVATKPQDSAFCFLSGPVYRRRNSWHPVPDSFFSLSSTLICVNFLASPHSPDVRSFFRSPGILSSHYNNFVICIEASDSRELCFVQLVPRIIILYLSIFWLPRSLRKCVFFVLRGLIVSLQQLVNCIEFFYSRELCFVQLVPGIMVIFYLSIFSLPRILLTYVNRKCVFVFCGGLIFSLQQLCDLHRGL
jgi:hypothetical protein